jgi:hypothetical protein
MLTYTDSSRNYTVVAQYLHTSSFYQILHLLSKFSIYSSLSELPQQGSVLSWWRISKRSQPSFELSYPFVLLGHHRIFLSRCIDSTVSCR